MKHVKLLGLFLMIATSLSAQYRNISFQKSDVPNLEIKQIDFREQSTLIHFTYTNLDTAGYYWINAGENFEIIDNETQKKYKLLNGINIPIGDKRHFLDTYNQIHNFSLEFEKLPDSTDNINIIENTDRGFNFYGVKIDKQVKQDFLNIDEFIRDTPVKEFGFYYKDNIPVFYFKHKGIMLAVMMTYDNNYGKYYQANILFQNNSGRDINFNPMQITASCFLREKTAPIKVLTYNEFMKKVQNRQAWSAFAIAFSESMAASNAGYSSSTTNTSVYGSSNSYGSASGYVGNTYGSVYGSSSTYSSAYGRSTTNSYNGAAAYAAQQNASNNISNYQGQQFQIKKTLSEGYLKLNTISNQTEYIGYINIDYKKVDRLYLNIPLNGTVYKFIW